MLSSDSPHFGPVANTGVSRRALLFMPFAFGGLTILSSRHERSLADPAESGTGSPVKVALFSDSGQRIGAVEVKRIVKTDAEWRRSLHAEQYAVTRRKGTEAPYTGAYWNQHEDGLYRCVCCGTALFASSDKFDSHTGWPSFTAPIAAENIRTEKDISLLIERVEVMCPKCDAHLGHVFEDGPEPTGLRYCINSAALSFVPRAKTAPARSGESSIS